MQRVPKKHRREVVLHGYEATVTRIDRADSTDVSTEVLYFEAESISRVYLHIIHKVHPPEWLSGLCSNDETAMDYDNAEGLTEKELEEFFHKAYGDLRFQEGDYEDKYLIQVREWEAPEFQLI